MAQVRLFCAPASPNHWLLVARIRHDGDRNILTAPPGVPVPEQFADGPASCDRCQIVRQQRETYLVAKDQLVKQVGSSFLTPFTGHETTAQALRALETWLLEAAKLCQEASDIAWGDVPPRPTLVNTEEYLAYVAADIRQNGWASRAAAGFWATADCALVVMFDEEPEPLLDEDWDTARQVLAWVAYWVAVEEVNTTLPRPSKRSGIPTLSPPLATVPRAKAPLWQQSRMSTWRRDRLSVIVSLTKVAGTAVGRRNLRRVSMVVRWSRPALSAHKRPRCQVHSGFFSTAAAKSASPAIILAPAGLCEPSRLTNAICLA
jgi:hypothetical protein